MAEERREKKSSKKWIWCAGVVLGIAMVILGLLWQSGVLDYQTIDERLAAIEEARAIPDEENAAIIYNRLLEDYDESSLSPNFIDSNTHNLIRSEWWLSKDYPEVAEWLKEQESTISMLLEASKKEQCRFPIIIDPVSLGGRMELTSAMRRWVYLLLFAANNDIGEGRIDAGVEKNLCVIQIAKHLYQQTCKPQRTSALVRRLSMLDFPELV